MDRYHTINPEVEIMNTEMQKSLELLHQFEGKESCCIFRVPHSLLEINKEAYQPQIVSIGPYHHGKDHPIIQEHKLRYLDFLLQKMLYKRKGEPLKSLLNSIVLEEKKIRQSYSESIDHFCSNDLAKMMVLDGVFLIESFRRFGRIDHENDDIVKMVWVFPFLMRDFLRMENQIPFFVLQQLFNLSSTEGHELTLQSLIIKFFNYGALRPKEVLSKYDNLKGKHLLDFFRKSFLLKEREYAVLERKHFFFETSANDIIGVNRESWESFMDIYFEPMSQMALTGNKEMSDDDTSFERIQPTTKLVVAGVKFKKNPEAKSFLDIKFQNGVLLIPHINLDDFNTHFILNGIVFEQCYPYCSKDITTYIVFLGCLINTSMDVGLLSESKIIQNYLGTDKELVKFFNNVGKYVAFDVEDNYLKDVFKEINDYCDDGCHVGWAGFKHTYFDSPWTAISAFAAFVLLCLTVTQTFYTVYPYFYERI